VEEFKTLVRSGVATKGLLDWTPSKARIPVAGEGAGCIFNSIKDGKKQKSRVDERPGAERKIVERNT
jgi:hypothetical protein